MLADYGSEWPRWAVAPVGGVKADAWTFRVIQEPEAFTHSLWAMTPRENAGYKSWL